jgi:presenilin-like A22 family membrane protease
MKHNLQVTFILIAFFLGAQIIGLLVTSEYIIVNKVIDPVTLETKIELGGNELPYNLERPNVSESTSYIWIIAAIFIGTILLLLIIKYRKMNLWKIWFFLAVFATISISFFPLFGRLITPILAFTFALIKVFRNYPIANNLIEIFIYGGLAAIFVPILNVRAAVILLILISIYDIIAVRHTKHMVRIAKFQSSNRMFAGFSIPYGNASKNKSKKIKNSLDYKTQKGKGKVAVLGGGDIGFPLLFAGAVMKEMLIIEPFSIVFIKTLLIPIFASIALTYLLFIGKKDRFYPAMPYLTTGCLIGYLLIFLIP